MWSQVSASERGGNVEMREKGREREWRRRGRKRWRVGQVKYCAHGCVANMEIKDTDAG